MTTGFDQVLAGLDDTPVETAIEAKPKRKRSSPRAAKAQVSEQRGKRADEEFVQVNGFIRKGYRASLHYYAKEEGVAISELIGRLLEEYVEKRGGILGKPRRR